MGVFAPPAPYLVARAGSRLAVAAAVLARRHVRRRARRRPGAAGVVLLTIPVGIGMGLAGAMLPVAVKERFADRPGLRDRRLHRGDDGRLGGRGRVRRAARALGDGWRTPLLVFAAVSVGARRRCGSC